MECPNCKENSGGVMYEDPITCDKCDHNLIISYCACHICGYTWRLNNGVFMDGNLINGEGVNQMLDELESLIKDEFGDDDDVEVKTYLGNVKRNNNSRTMSDMIHKCIKCGEMAYPTNNHGFKCSSCGFEWEMLDGEDG